MSGVAPSETAVLAGHRQREGDSPVGEWRIGSVDSLNVVPLTWGIEPWVQYMPPSALARLLRTGELDAALVSVTEVLLTGRYEAIEGIGIASRGPVASVILAHRGPRETLREVYCDPASLTSVNLVRVLLAERGIRPAFRKLTDYAQAAEVEAALLIGDRALDFVRRQPRTSHQIWDLGAAWQEATGLPFVYAVWAVRPGLAEGELGRILRQARDRGLADLERIIEERREYERDFRRAYFRRHIRFTLGPEEVRGVTCFGAWLTRHGVGTVYPVRFVGGPVRRSGGAVPPGNDPGG